MHVTEDEPRKPKAKLESKKSSKAPITKSTVEKRLIQHGMKKHLRVLLICIKKHNIETTFGEKSYNFPFFLSIPSMDTVFFKGSRKAFNCFNFKNGFH